MASFRCHPDKNLAIYSTLIACYFYDGKAQPSPVKWLVWFVKGLRIISID
ncbi:hypothetical protein QWZ16_00315 [Vibrio ostreicida]|uniref:Uncharacterized protein n=1 Tax=Vibrio ostreicida TaxID=526588 RepID=A0ABT8BM75_9VIBR|nr:hypothetical protein [Vibrio ostreicida]MDN3608237.1 hypothetical protein [Vibrio ostreicida]